MQVNTSEHKQTWMNKSRIHIEHKWTQENTSSLRTREYKWTWIKFDWKGSRNEYQPNKEWRLETIAKLKERTFDSCFPQDYHLHSWQRVTPKFLFYEDPPYIAYHTFFKFCPTFSIFTLVPEGPCCLFCATRCHV